MLRRMTQIIVPLKRTISKLTNNSSPQDYAVIVHHPCFKTAKLIFVHVVTSSTTAIYVNYFHVKVIKNKVKHGSFFWYIHRMPSALPGSPDFLPKDDGYDDKLSMLTVDG